MDSARGVGIQLPRQSTLFPIAGQKQRTTMGHVFTSGSPGWAEKRRSEPFFTSPVHGLWRECRREHVYGAAAPRR